MFDGPQATLHRNYFGGLTEGTLEFTIRPSNVAEGVLIANQLDGFNTTALTIGASVDGNGWGPGVLDPRGYSGEIDPGHLFFHPFNAGPTLKSVTALLPGVEYEIRLAFSQTSASLYIDGVLDTTVSGNFSTPLLPNSIASIAAWRGEGGTMMSPFRGEITEAKLFDTANALGHQSTYALFTNSDDGSVIIQGSLADDRLYGNATNDAVLGNEGDDTMSGGPGDDTIRASSGNDVVYAGPGSDGMYGGSGTDTVSYAGYTQPVSLDLASGLAGGSASGDFLSGFETVIGGSADDILLGSSSDNRLRGLAGNDTLNGMDGNDLVQGGDGQDSLLGGDGRDRLTGQAGNDTLIGGAGNDQMSGGSGDDTFVFMGAFGEDVIYDFGADGQDTAQISDTTTGFDATIHFDVTADGVIDAADAALTANVALGPDGLTLSFNATGTKSITFHGTNVLDATDLLFV